MSWVFSDPKHVLSGLPFAAAVMFFFLAHEMGHYLYCRRYGIYATLPFFIPMPTLIGTMGAVILIKFPIRSRKALFDIGIAGPIAGPTLAHVQEDTRNGDRALTWTATSSSPCCSPLRATLSTNERTQFHEPRAPSSLVHSLGMCKLPDCM